MVLNVDDMLRVRLKFHPVPIISRIEKNYRPELLAMLM